MTTEEFHVLLKTVLSLAWTAGGQGILWIGIGGLIGFLTAAVSLFGLYRLLSRSDWPANDRIGRWGRRGLLVFWIFTVPVSLSGVGACWGAVAAVVKTLDAEGVIDRAGVAVLRKPLSIACTVTEEWAQEANWTKEEKERRTREFSTGERKFDLAQVEQQEQRLRDDIADAIETHVIDAKDPENPDSVEQLLRWMFHFWVLERELDSVMDHAHVTLDEMHRRHGDQPVAVDQISAVVVQLHFKEFIFRELRRFRWLCVKFAAGELLLLIAIPMVMVEFLSRMGFVKTVEASDPNSLEK